MLRKVNVFIQITFGFEVAEAAKKSKFEDEEVSVYPLLLCMLSRWACNMCLQKFLLVLETSICMY